MVTIQINSVDQSSVVIYESLNVTQNLSDLVDVCNFRTRKYGDRTFKPEYGDDVKVYDDADCVFGGIVMKVHEVVESGGGGVVYEAQCADYTVVMDRLMVGRTFENQSIKAIITDILSSYAPDFNADNVDSDFVIPKIVFNQITVSQCIKKLADIVQYDWYVDENKSVHFFGKYTNMAPFNLTDSSGNYVYTSLERNIDGSQIVNRVKVRGGSYDGPLFTDVITVNGNSSKSFKLPRQMANLTIEVDAGSGYVSKNVGIDNIDDFTTDDVLYSFQDQSFRFENALTDGNKIRFSGNPKINVMAIAEDDVSIKVLRDKYEAIYGTPPPDGYGVIEKVLRDNSIESNEVARRRAAAELYSYSQAVIDAKFYTYDSGLRTGMVINLSSSRRDCDDDLIIKTVTFRMIDPMNFGYQVECVSTKRYNFIEILRSLMEPEIKENDEISEETKIDNAIEGIQEEHTVVNPYEDDVDEGTQEQHGINLLGQGVGPTPVWGYYAPTSDTDPKRMFKWGRFKWLP